MSERFYGGNGTIHQTEQLDVETHNGKVVAVWFRCSVVPFRQVEVDERRAHEMESFHGDEPALIGLTFSDG